MKKTPEQSEVEKALNQLISIVVGAKFAKESDYLQDRPRERVQKCLELALAEYGQASSLLQDSPPEAKAKLAQVHRKLDSLQSLIVLATFSEETAY